MNLMADSVYEQWVRAHRQSHIKQNIAWDHKEKVK